MKPALINILILSFLGVAVFGFLAMGHEAGHKSFCLAKIAGEAACPEKNLLGQAIFHTSVFKSFSLAVLVFLISALAGLTFLNFLPKTFSSFFQLSLNRIFFCETPQIKLSRLHWLSLHENSPSAF